MNNNCQPVQQFCIPDCGKEDTYLIDLIREIQTGLNLLEEYYKNLSLSDLTDVRDCLAPNTGDSLVYDGEMWDANNPNSIQVEQLLHEGTPIAKITVNNHATTLYCKNGTVVEVIPAKINGEKYKVGEIIVDGVTKTLYGKGYDEAISRLDTIINNLYEVVNHYHSTSVEVTPEVTEGVPIASISVDGVVQEIKIPNQVTNVIVTQVQETGPTIATITVDDTTTEIKAPPAQESGLANINVNNIAGTVANRIASLVLTGADINITGYTESEDINDDLELASTDTVNEAFGKLAKALKDDEAVVTRAFLQVEDSTGFNDNLEYVPEESTTLLGNAKNLQDADAILMNNLVPLIQFKAEVLDINKIVFSGGTSGTVKIGQNALNPNNGYQIAIPYEGNCTNVTYRFPPATYASGAQYYTISTVISSLEQYLLPPLIFTGRVITFETAAKTWEWWQYVGPMSQGVISPADWSDMSNWKKLNISYA